MATFNVTNLSQLQTAINTINAGAGGDTVILSDGTYDLTGASGSFRYYIPIIKPNVTIRSSSGNRSAVIIKGDGMRPSVLVGGPGSIAFIFSVESSGFTLEGVTCQDVGNHCIIVKAENGADNVTLRNCVFRNSFEMLVKGTADPNNASNYNDTGLIENCLFEYTAGIGPNSYIGGVDVHKGRNWIIRNNVFKGIASPNLAIPEYPGTPYVAEHAVHFWRDGYNITIENNLIINCDRGLGLGLGTGNTNNVKGGRIVNNMIYHANLQNHAFADVGIGIEDSPNVDIYHNTIFQEHDYPNAIEYRFSGTAGGNIKNNLTNKIIANRDGASASVSNNYTSAASGMFVNVTSGNLHLSSVIPEVVGGGIAISGITTDIDGNTRPYGIGVDIGADEYAGYVSGIPVGSILIADVAEWDKQYYELEGTITAVTPTSLFLPNGSSANGAYVGYKIRIFKSEIISQSIADHFSDWVPIIAYNGETKTATVARWTLTPEYQPSQTVVPTVGQYYAVTGPTPKYAVQRRHQWQKDGQDILGMIGLSFTPSEPGTYTVKESAYFLRQGGTGEHWYVNLPSSVQTSSPIVVTGSRDTQLTYHDNFRYLGAFIAPEGNFGTSYGFSYGGRAMTFNPAGNGGAGSLIIGSHDTSHPNYLGEISIPSPASWAKTQSDSLPSATLLSGASLIDALEGQWGSVGSGSGLWTGVYSAVHGALIVGNKLILSAYVSYGANPINVFWRRPLNLSTTGQIEGPFIVADTTSDGGIYSYPRCYSGAMIPVPANMQSKVGAEYLCGMFGDSGAAYTSEGPAFAKLDPTLFDGKSAIRGTFGNSAANNVVLDSNASGPDYTGWHIVQTGTTGNPTPPYSPQYGRMITGWNSSTKTGTVSSPWLNDSNNSPPRAGWSYLLIPPVASKALVMYPGEVYSMMRVDRDPSLSPSSGYVGASNGPDRMYPQIWSWITRRQGGYLFPNGTRSVMSIQLGGNGYYGYGIANQSWGSSEGDPWFFAGDDIQYRGEGQFPYGTRVFAYDANDIEQVRLGAKKAYEITPYAVFPLYVPHRAGGEYTSSKPQGVAYDPATRRAYVSYSTGPSGRTIIHVFEITNAVAA